MSGGGEDIKSVRICERAANDQETEKKKLILVQFSHKVVAYDCRWSVTSCGVVVFTKPEEIYCRTDDLGDVSAVFTNGDHYWLIKQRRGWQPGGWFRTSVFKEPDVEPMAEDDWVREVGRDWAGVRVELPADWETVGEDMDTN